MSETTEVMELTEGDTPTASQEQKLLEGDSKNNPQTITNAPNAEILKASLQPTNLAGLKKIIEENANAVGAEMLMSFQTGEVKVTHPRSRSKSKRNFSKSNSKSESHVNPHGRTKSALEQNTPKRIRETGGTPPSATHPNKKAQGNTSENNVDQMDQHLLDKKEKKRLKAKRQRDRKREREAIKPKAANKTETNLSVPPLNSKSQLSGSGASGDGEKPESNVLVPPVTDESKSTGSDNAVNVIAKQNAASLSSSKLKNVVNQHIQTPMDDDSGVKTYAEVTDNHCAAIIDQRQPGQMQLLDQQRFDKINALLTDHIMSMIGSKAELPVFDDTRLHSGAMRIRCANSYTRKWLESNVPKLDAKKLWNGAKLVVIDFKDIPRPHKFNVLFRGIMKSPQDIFRLLETQNKGVTTKSWSVLHCNRIEGGTRITIGVGQDSFQLLQQSANSLYCGLGKAQFTVVKNCTQNKAMKLKATVTKETDATKATDTKDLNQMQTNEGLQTDKDAKGINPKDQSATGTEQ